MLDPGLEHMHRHGRLWRASNDLRRLWSETLFDLSSLIPIGLVFALAPAGHWAPPLALILLVGGLSATQNVRFEIGSGSCSPTQLLSVPLWFSVPAPWIPVLTGLTLAIAGVVEHFREHKTTPLWVAVRKAGDAWPAIGPAIVFAIAGPHHATIDAVWLVAIAFAAQLLIDVAVGTLIVWWQLGMPPSNTSRLVVWVASIDAALLPVGFMIAVVMETEPLAVVAAFPLVAVIAEFSRERRERIDQALQLSSAYRGTAQLMGDVLEADDAYTGGEHTQGVVEMAVATGLEMRLSPRDMRDLEFGALLHDIGKLRVPNDIINKPGSLTSTEWEVIRKHPVYGQQMLDRVGGAMTDAGHIVRAHHERWDGLGYPDRLVGEQIPLAARIITACDSFSAMTTNRSYRLGMSDADGLDELRRCSGTQFDPAVVAALIGALERDPALRRPSERATFDRRPSPIAAALGIRPLA